MKFMLAATLVANSSSLLWAMPTSQIWYFDQSVPDLEDITFPMNIANAPPETGYYFAQQFGFKGTRSLAYTGLQPRENFPDGRPKLHAVFSSFIPGTNTSHPNCRQGADGDPGVSCAIDISGDYQDTWNLVVQHVTDNTWRGLLVDTPIGDFHVIGEWILPPGAGNLDSTQTGFVEYFPWNRRNAVKDCQKLPRTQVTFGIPTTTNSAAGTGHYRNIEEYGHCVRQTNFTSFQSVDFGVEISAGWDNAEAA